VVLFDRSVRSDRNLPSHFQQFLFPDPLHWGVIEISAETEIEHFSPVGNVVSTRQCRSIFPWLVPLVSDQSFWHKESTQSNNHLHLTELKDCIYSFQFEFYGVYFKLIYMLLGIISQPGFSPNLNIPCFICQKSPDWFPLFSFLELSTITVFFVSVVHVSLV